MILQQDMFYDMRLYETCKEATTLLRLYNLKHLLVFKYVTYIAIMEKNKSHLSQCDIK